MGGRASRPSRVRNAQRTSREPSQLGRGAERRTATSLARLGTIDSRGGQLRGYDVGDDAGFFLLEGDFVSAEVVDDVLHLVLRELQINVMPI